MMKLRSHWKLVLCGLMVLAGLMMLALSLRQTVRIEVDGQVIEHTTFAIRPIDILKEAGFDISQDDRVTPARGRLFFNANTIQVQRAQAYRVITPEETIQVVTAERNPANILKLAGIRLYPHDDVLINGLSIDPNLALPEGSPTSLQFNPAKTITLNIDGDIRIITSSQPTLGMALAEAGISLHPKDQVSEDLDSALKQSIEVEIRSARQITVTIGSEQVTGFSSQSVVGAALLDLGVSLQGLDVSVPGENAPIPADGHIQVVSIREALVLMTDESPFTSSYEPDPNTEIDQYSVVQPGQVGMVVTRSRIRYADGKEILREDDPAWKASDPEPGVLGYGTQVVVRSEVVDGQTIEYWRKISVYATSYSPCKQGYDYCTTGTASGETLTKGIVAVLVSWYRDMKFQRVYIPGYGYGIIADTGGGIPGRPWIDLGFDEANYESWHFWTSMYFLTPVPQYIPYLLP